MAEGGGVLAQGVFARAGRKGLHAESEGGRGGAWCDPPMLPPQPLRHSMVKRGLRGAESLSAVESWGLEGRPQLDP